ncbi:MAG: nitrilase family protein [bacterium]|nr:nitrilase family protein [bacterium]
MNACPEVSALIRTAAVQFMHRPADLAYNWGRVEHFCAQAAVQGVQIIAFPEMCITGYWHVRHLNRAQVEELAEVVPMGASSQRLVRISAQHNMIIGVGLIEAGQDGQLYNTYVVAQPDGRVDAHRKLHCFVSPHMASGNRYTVFDTHLGCRLGVLICWDNNLVENARLTALQGAQILLAPHQTGGCASRSPHAMGRIDPALWHQREQDPESIRQEFVGPKGRQWLLRWLPARAHDNGMFLVFANGVGLDDDEVRTGNSMILDCYGRTLAETDVAADALVVADLDLSLLDRCTGRRWIRGRRPELYGPLAEATGAELDPRAARFSEDGTL